MILLASVRRVGKAFMDGLRDLEGVLDVRGRGLMVGVTLADRLDAPVVRDRCLEAGLVLNCPGPGMLRFLRPLVIGAADVEEALAVLGSAIAGMGSRR